MIAIKFKNLEKSEIVKTVVEERMDTLLEKFPDLGQSKISIQLSMENSPKQAGPDLFKVKVHISKGRYSGVTCEKSDGNLYVALAEVIDHLLECFNRHGDRNRVVQIKKQRRFANIAKGRLTPA